MRCTNPDAIRRDHHASARQLRFFVFRSAVWLAASWFLLAAESPLPDGKAAAAFRLTQTQGLFQEVDLRGAIQTNSFGLPALDGSRLNLAAPAVVTRSHSLIVLENRYLKLTLLPEMGRVFSLVSKITGHEQLWTNAVAKPLLGQHNDAGWWMVRGGVEYTIPRGEHGTTWSLPWSYGIVEDSRKRKTVRMTVREPKTQLEQVLEISIVPDSVAYQAIVEIANRSQTEQKFSLWVNPMWAPGGRGELTANTELIVPCEAMLVPDRSFTRWMLGDRRQEFSQNPLRWIKYWRGPGDLLAINLASGFFGAYSHDADEGIVRVFDRRKMPGMDIWTWGFPPPAQTQREYSLTPNLGYVEMWGGTAVDFSDAALRPLAPGQTFRCQEWMYAVHGLGGLTEATEQVAVVFRDQPFKACELGLFSTSLLRNLDAEIRFEQKTVWQKMLDVDPRRPYRTRVVLSAPRNSRTLPPQLILRYRGQQLITAPAQPILPIRWGSPYLPAATSN